MNTETSVSVFSHHRLECFGLCLMPVLNGAIQSRFERGVKLKVLCGLMQFVAPVLITESHQPGCGQDFFRAMALRTLITSWTQLLLRMGSRVRISEPAAARMAMAARVVGSIEYWNLAKV